MPAEVRRGKKRAEKVKPTPAPEDDVDEDTIHADEDEAGVSESGLQKIMQLLGDDGLNEADIAALKELRGDEEEDEEEEMRAAEPAPDAEGRRRITYDQYMQYVNLLVLRVNEIERATQRGVSRSALIEWFLEQHEDEIETMQQLHDERAMIDRVINKLIKDGYLVELPEDEEEVIQGMVPTRRLMVHPQVDVDSL